MGSNPSLRRYVQRMHERLSGVLKTGNEKMTGKKRTGPSNIQLSRLIVMLRKKNKDIWSRVANDLEKSTRSRREVNLSRIERNAAAGEILVVPGKVLADGRIDKKIEIAAFRFSAGAKQKIEKAGGKTMTIEQLVSKNPEAKGVRIIG